MLRNLISGLFITVLLDIIDRYSIIVKGNLKARGFTEYKRLALPLQNNQEYKPKHNCIISD